MKIYQKNHKEYRTKKKVEIKQNINEIKDNNFEIKKLKLR